MDTVPAFTDSGAKARAIIRRKGYRMGWVSEQLGIAPSYLSRLLSGERRLTDPWVEKLAAVLGVAVEELR